MKNYLDLCNCDIIGFWDYSIMNYELLLRVVFSCFHGQNRYFPNFVTLFALKKLHYIYLMIFLAQNLISCSITFLPPSQDWFCFFFWRSFWSDSERFDLEFSLIDKSGKRKEKVLKETPKLMSQKCWKILNVHWLEFDSLQRHNC